MPHSNNTVKTTLTLNASAHLNSLLLQSISLYKMLPKTKYDDEISATYLKTAINIKMESVDYRLK